VKIVGKVEVVSRMLEIVSRGLQDEEDLWQPCPKSHAVHHNYPLGTVAYA
jgi:hypothetical protein